MAHARCMMDKADYISGSIYTHPRDEAPPHARTKQTQKYAILFAFPRQRWSREGAPLLRLHVHRLHISIQGLQPGTSHPFLCAPADSKVIHATLFGKTPEKQNAKTSVETLDIALRRVLSPGQPEQPVEHLGRSP